MKCRICGRPLRVKKSRLIGMGPVCEKRDRRQLKLFEREEIEHLERIREEVEKE